MISWSRTSLRPVRDRDVHRRFDPRLFFSDVPLYEEYGSQVVEVIPNHGEARKPAGLLFLRVSPDAQAERIDKKDPVQLPGRAADAGR